MEKLINISEKQYKLKNDDIIALMKFEEISGKNAFTISEYNLTDSVLMLYSILSACNPDFNFTLDQFKKMLQADKNIIAQYFTFLGENSGSKKKAVK